MFTVIFVFLSALLYSSAFLYFFSFNENFLLVFFFVIFMYVINSKLIGLLFDSADAESLEIYLTLKEETGKALRELRAVRNELEVYTQTPEFITQSIENLIGYQLTSLVLLEKSYDILENQLVDTTISTALERESAFIARQLERMAEEEGSVTFYEE